MPFVSLGGAELNFDTKNDANATLHGQITASVSSSDHDILTSQSSAVRTRHMCVELSLSRKRLHSAETIVLHAYDRGCLVNVRFADATYDMIVQLSVSRASPRRGKLRGLHTLTTSVQLKEDHPQHAHCF